jgi:hypothetical protein
MVYVVTKVTLAVQMSHGVTVFSKRNFILAQKESASFLALNLMKLSQVQQHPVHISYTKQVHILGA